MKKIINYWQQIADEGKTELDKIGSESWLKKAIRYQEIHNLMHFAKSVHDVGCATGGFYEYIKDCNIEYIGSDLLKCHIDEAKKKYGNKFKVLNILKDKVEPADYFVMSGLFFRKQGLSHNEMKDLFYNMIIKAFELCRKGVIFNLLDIYANYTNQCNWYIDLHYVNSIITELSGNAKIVLKNREFTVAIYKKNIKNEALK